MGAKVSSMAYKSFKELLGETSLERKCRFLFGLCLLVLITGSFWWYGSRTKELVFTTTRSTCILFGLIFHSG